MVGPIVGSALGDAEGLLLGDCDGEALGEVDGLPEGDSLGDVDGLALGEKLGLELGDADGDAVGDAEGETLGRVVGGAWYHTSSSSTVQPVADDEPQKSLQQLSPPTRHANVPPKSQLPPLMSELTVKSLRPNVGPWLRWWNCACCPFPAIRSCRNPFDSENMKLVGECA